MKIDDVGNLQDFKYIGRVYVSLVESVKIFQNFFYNGPYVKVRGPAQVDLCLKFYISPFR